MIRNAESRLKAGNHEPGTRNYYCHFAIEETGLRV